MRPVWDGKRSRGVTHGAATRSLSNRTSSAWLLAGWLIVAAPLASSKARATSWPPPVFAAPVANPFGLASVVQQAVPGLADIDGDGDLDAFVGELDGDLSFFRNTGAASAPAFATASLNPFGLVAVAGYSAAPRFVDIDGDGDLDVLAGDQLGEIVLLRNTGTRTSPAFASASLNPFGLTSVAGYASPALADVDGDGDLDALVGDAQGNVQFFRNTGSAISPTFATASANPFGLSDVGTYATASLADVDGDGDLDACVGDDDGDLALFANTGGATSPAFAAPVTAAFGIAYVGPAVASAWGDLDGDGDLDLVVGNYVGETYLLANVQGSKPSPRFDAPSANPFGLADVGVSSAPRFADLDGDGDLDGFVGASSGATYFFPNSGSATNAAFGNASAGSFGLGSVGADSTPAFGDLDGDGDLDALVGSAAGDLDLFANDGSATSPDFASVMVNPFGLTPPGPSASPALVDVDGDGDLDALVGVSSGDLVFFRNTGSATSPAFASASTNPFGLADVGSDAAPAFADLDGDGAPDAYVGNAAGAVVEFHNTGSRTSPAFVESGGDPLGVASSAASSIQPAFADLDGDGDVDALIGAASGDTLWIRNQTRQLVFEDGFESGTTGDWSAAVP